jgi:DNA-binding transcriptional LysR family regulator
MSFSNHAEARAMAATTLLPSLVDMDLARTFVAICEEGNFTRAADRVHRTPSAVSLQVKKLEGLLNRPLFDRETRMVRLTADGEVLLSYARRLLALNDEVLARFRDAPLEGTVRLGAPNDSGVLALPAILRRFAATHPQVRVDVRLDTGRSLYQRQGAGELDVIVFSMEAMATSSLAPVHVEELVWAGLRGGRAVERRPLPLALADPGCAWRALALAALDRQGIPHRVAYASEMCRGQIAAVEADLAIAPLPASAVTPPLVRLGAAQGLPPLGHFNIYLTVRDDAGPAADALADHVADQFRSLADSGHRLFA